MLNQWGKVIAALMLSQIVVPVANAEVDHSQICKAAIAAIFSQPIGNLSVQSQGKEITHVSYTRQSDGSVWKNKCKVTDDRVIWGSQDGRWRDSALDEIITFKAANSKITILQTFRDGSSISNSYDLN